MKACPLLVFSIMLPGCRFVAQDSGGDPFATGDIPILSMAPRHLNFGAVAVVDTLEHVEIVTVSNLGDADLSILNIELEAPDVPFTVSSIQSVVVPPGNNTQFEVVYDPSDTSLEDTQLLISSNDPETPVAQVRLTGEGIAPSIEIDPVSYDFGTRYVGCEDTLALAITNIGNADLVLEDYAFSTGSAEMTFGGIGDLNGDEAGLMTLVPAEYEEVFISYLPLDEYVDTAYLLVDSNDPFTPQAQVSQEGGGAYFDTNLDVFEQPGDGSTDILFAVDTSDSMASELPSVIDNLVTFVTIAIGMGSDFHVAVIQADDGCINDDAVWIDNSFTVPQAEAAIATMIDRSDSYPSYAKRAFTLFGAAVAETGSGGCNEGLVRASATLNLVGISDAPEQSSNDWTYYVTLFQSSKADPDDVVIHAVGGDYPSGCSGAAAYTGLYEATVATGGQFLSICASDWAKGLSTIADTSGSALDRFQLSAEAVPGTLLVRIDGVSATQGWSLDEAGNALVFDSEHIPDGHTVIEVEYAVRADCG